MNIFCDWQGILGRPETRHLKTVLQQFYGLAGVIRGQLGKQGYLLDKYLHDLLTALNDISAFDAADRGNEMAGELYALCCKAAKGEPSVESSPLGKIVSEYVSAHPLPYQEVLTRTNLYLSGVMDEVLETLTTEFFREQKARLRERVDIIYLHDLYREINARLGNEEMMEHLNLLVRQRFQAAAPVQVFLQGLMNGMVDALTAVDVETGWTTLRVRMEGK